MKTRDLSGDWLGRARGFEIHFGDESGFRADAVQGHNWGVNGETPLRVWLQTSFGKPTFLAGFVFDRTRDARYDGDHPGKRVADAMSNLHVHDGAISLHQSIPYLYRRLKLDARFGHRDHCLLKADAWIPQREATTYFFGLSPRPIDTVKRLCE